jgi:hypothetical protein
LKSIGQQIKFLERLQHILDGRTPGISISPAPLAAIMVAILAAIFNMVAKTDKKFRSAPMLQLQRKLIFRGF